MEDLILEGLFAIGAALFGAATAYIVYKIAEKITSSNLPDIIRRAIRASNEKKMKQHLGKMIKAHIDRADNGVVVVSISDLDDDGKDADKIQIESSAGIDSSIRQGMTLKTTV